MKTKTLLPFVILATLVIAGCQSNSNPSNDQSSDDYQSATLIPEIVIPDEITVNDPVNTGDFALTTSNGNFTQSGNIYTITKAGTYSAKGVLEGQILVSAGSDDAVILSLEGATISYNLDSPIKAVTADKFTVTAKENTANLVKDLRNVKTVEDETVGEGAINSKTDLVVNGTGTLVVEGNYNNGVHTSDDLKVQSVTLKSTAYNNALKGNDSVTVKSGTILAISQNGQGIKTKNSDISSKGNQRGTIEIDGGNIQIDSVYDAIDASYDVVINQSSDSVPTAITIKTGSNAKYKANYDKTSSSKGLKAENSIDIKKGTIVVAASDDAVHANYGGALENGKNGLGNISISGGALSIASGDDGLHADNTLTISGGTVIITGSKEGLEANHIKIQGGETYVRGNDDGVNASKKINETPTIEVSGGLLDVSVSNGDTDGIDSNGSFTQTGGVVIARGSPGTNPSNMSTSLDCDGNATLSGGTFIAFNGMEKTPSFSNNVLKAMTENATGQGGRPGGGGGGRPTRNAITGLEALTTTSFSAGNYNLKGEGLDITFLNNYQYATFIIYSSNLVLNKEYTLSLEGKAVLSWKQSSNNTTIS